MPKSSSVHCDDMLVAFGIVFIIIHLVLQCVGVRRLRRMRTGSRRDAEPPMPEPVVNVYVHVESGSSRVDLERSIAMSLKLCAPERLTFVYDDTKEGNMTRIAINRIMDSDEYKSAKLHVDDVSLSRLETILHINADYALIISPHCFITRDVLSGMIDETAYGNRSVIALASLDPVHGGGFVDHVHSSYHDTMLRAALLGGWRHGVGLGAKLQHFKNTDAVVSTHMARIPSRSVGVRDMWDSARRTRREERKMSCLTTISRMAAVPTFSYIMWACVAGSVTTSAVITFILMAWRTPRSMQHWWIYGMPAYIAGVLWSTLVVVM